jgi:hypothetical protein
MKQALFASTLSLLFSVTFSQTVITVDTLTSLMSQGTHLAYHVEIPQVKLKTLEKNWCKYTALESKTKPVLINGEYVQSAAVNRSFSLNPFNVYSKLMDTAGSVSMTVWLSENDTVFISPWSGDEKDIAARKYVRDFALEQYKEAVKLELDAETDRHKQMQKEDEGIISQQEKAAKKISQNQHSIQKAKDDIAKNNADIQTRSHQINDAKDMVERTVSDENANKGAKKTLKDLESDKRKLQKDNENQNKNIDDWGKEIREKEREIADLKQSHEAKLKEIAIQREKVQAVQIKLENIR